MSTHFGTPQCRQTVLVQAATDDAEAVRPPRVRPMRHYIENVDGLHDSPTHEFHVLAKQGVCWDFSLAPLELEGDGVHARG